MPFLRVNRTRYITVCQQLLVTAVVSAVGVTAAGVMTLDIVAPTTGAGAGAPTRDLSPAVRVQGTEYGKVDSHPITPKVREVAVPALAPTTTPKTTPKLARKAPSSTKGPAQHGLTLAVLSAPQKVTGYATAGVTWAPGTRLAENQVAVQIRTLKAGVWSRWQKVDYHDDHGPDAGTAEADRVTRPGTDAITLGDVDKVQMRAETATGKAPRDVRLAVIDPGTDSLSQQPAAIDTAKIPASDVHATASAPIEKTTPAGDQQARLSSGGSDSVSLTAMAVAPKPQIFSRAQWGANEHVREAGNPDYGTIKAGFVHHTVNANDYTPDEVPALIRGIYAYHVYSRGWRDIGYNFLVDRFGRIWEGRYGGVDRAVVGAHTLGYNEVSFAMSSIGNFDIYDNGRGMPPQKLLDAYAKLYAWKLSLYGVHANATHVWLKDRYVNAINGHRDVGQTACPGRYLYAKIPVIRQEAEQIQEDAQKGTPPPPPPPTTPVFSSPTQAPQPSTPQPSGITFPASSNLTGSSWPDLVLQSPTNAISVLPTGGIAGFAAPVVSKGAWGQRRQIQAVGDVTGDGKADVLARSQSDGVLRIYPSDGQGHVSSTPAYAKPGFAHLQFIFTAGDWDGDGHDDLFARNSQDGTLYLYRGKGGGKFALRKPMLTGANTYTSMALTSDLDGDGHADVAALGKNHRLYLLPGTATGFKPAIDRRDLGTAYDQVLLGGGDYTGDGLGDLMVRNATTKRALIFPGTGKGTFSHFNGPLTGIQDLSNLSATQMTGSSQPDVVGRNPAGDLVVVPHNGRRNALPVISSQRTTSTGMAVLNVGDWNRDGIPDIMTRQGSLGNRLVLNPGLGGGRFDKGVWMGDGWKSITRLAPVGDVTGDKNPDLVGKSATGVMEIYPGDGKHGFKAPVKAAQYLKTYNQLGTHSWNTTALPGSVVSSSDETFVPFAAGVGAGTAMHRSGGSMSTYDWMIGPGDVDGDGIADIVARQKADGTLWLIPGTDTGFGQRIFLAAGFKGYKLGG